MSSPALLTRHLDALQAAGLIVASTGETSSFTSAAYQFRHALIQDAAYNSLLRSQQRAAHRAAGEVLEVLFADRLSSAEVGPQLAYHFQAAGDHARALRYFTLAGEAAARGYANAEAVSHFSSAVALARQIAAPAATLIHLYSRLGRAHELNLAYPDALAVYEALAALGQERNEPALELESLIRRATVCSTISPAFNPPQALALAAQSLALAHQLGDREAEARIEWNLLLVHNYTGQPAAAAQHGQAALDLARALAAETPADHGRQELLAFVLTDIALAYIGVEQTRLAGQVLVEARALWQSLGNLPMLAEATTREAVYHMIRGELGPAAEFYAEAGRLCTVSHNLEGQVVSQALAGIALMSLGRFGEALSVMQQAIDLGASTGNPIALAGTRAELAYAYGLLGQGNLAEEVAGLALQAAQQRFPPIIPWVLAAQATNHLYRGDLIAAESIVAQLPPYRAVRNVLTYMPPQWVRVGLVTAAVHLARGRLDTAAEVIASLLADLRLLDMAASETEALLLSAKILQAQSRHAEAENVLRRAAALAAEQSNCLAHWPILLELASLAHARGDITHAAALRAHARRLVEDMAGSLQDPTLRASLLATPQARATLSQ
jgi:tetratricopeptide (TPR) repeat protein